MTEPRILGTIILATLAAFVVSAALTLVGVVL